MSWAAHDLEPYAIQAHHSQLKIAFVPLLLGSYAPDLMTKWYVYGIHLGPWDLKADNAAQFHRGWPGLGFTHSFLYGAVICLIFWKGLGSKNWGISFMIGQWAHALTDAGDTVGTMLLLPVDVPRELRRVGVRGPDGTTDRRRRLLQRARRHVGPRVDRLRRASAGRC